MLGYFSIEVVAELHEADVEFTQTDGASGTVFFFADIFSDGLQLLESLTVTLLLALAQLLEIPLFFLKNPFEPLAIKNHSLHGDIRLLQSR